MRFDVQRQLQNIIMVITWLHLDLSRGWDDGRVFRQRELFSWTGLRAFLICAW